MPLFSRSTRRIVTFLGKVVAIYAVWYVLYDLWLLPDGRLDRWVSLSVVEVSRTVLDGAGFEATTSGRALSIPGTAGLRIVDGCNGLSTIGLFAGFVLAFPGRAWRRALFLPVGILVIYLSNVARVALLLLFQANWDGGFEFVHGLGAPTFFYLIVFGLWVLWANVGGSASGPSPAPPPTEANRAAPAP